MLNKQRMLTPGPTPLPEEVRLALARDMIHHRKPAFRELMHEVQAKLGVLFGTQSPVLPLACSGTGAMTAAIYSLFKPGEKILSVETGKFGQRWSEIAKSRGLAVRKLEVEWGQAANPAEIGAILKEEGCFAGVLMQLSETSTGVMNPARAIAAITSQTDELLVVDGISAVGISPCPMDEWKIDCLLTGSQKGLMLPPGLALIAFSERAWRKAESIEPGCFYFNLPAERAKLAKGETNFTSPINLIAGLKASLDLLLKNGLEPVYKKQWAMTMLVRAGLAALGLQLFAKSDFAWGVTAALAPQGIGAGELLRICQEEFGVIMAGGQDALKGKIIRVGHMGWVDWGDCLAGLAALALALQKSGFAPGAGWEKAAMQAYMAALASYNQGAALI